MQIIIDTASDIPLYEQIVTSVERLVQAGVLTGGVTLPSIRQLASDLEINANTVAKSYRILEARRIIKTAGRKGTFIREGASQSCKKSLEEEVRHLFGELVEKLTEKGANKALLKRAFKSVLDLSAEEGSHARSI